MDMQYQYTEKYVKDIAEAIRFIAGTSDTYSIKEMPAAIAASNPPMLGKPEDLFAAQFNDQLGTNKEVISWAIFSKYPDDSYLVTTDAINSNTTSALITKGFTFNSSWNRRIPLYRFKIMDDAWVMCFTRQENNPASGVYLDTDGYPHIPKDLPYIFPTKSFSGYDSNQGAWFHEMQSSGRHNEPDSIWDYFKVSDITINPVFKNSFKVFNPSVLNGRIPDELYSIISDGSWHTGSQLVSNTDILSTLGINLPIFPSGTTIRQAHWFNILGHSDDGDPVYRGYQWWGGHGGPCVVYLTSDDDKWYWNTTATDYGCFTNSNKGYLYQRDHGGTNITSDGHGIVTIGNGMSKDTPDLSNQTYNTINWNGNQGYAAPASAEELQAYIPWRTYDIKDKDGNVILQANATLADFGIT